MSKRTNQQRRAEDAARDRPPQRIGASGISSLGHAEAVTLAHIPEDTPQVMGALTYEQAIDVPGLTADQARSALATLTGAGRVRVWQEAPGLHLVARGPFRVCERCGKLTAPGPCGGPTYRCSAQYDHTTGQHTRTSAPALVYATTGPDGCGHDPAGEQEAA